MSCELSPDISCKLPTKDLREISHPNFWEKIRKDVNMSSAEYFTKSANS